MSYVCKPHLDENIQITQEDIDTLMVVFKIYNIQVPENILKMKNECDMSFESTHNLAHYVVEYLYENLPDENEETPIAKLTKQIIKSIYEKGLKECKVI